MLLRRAPATSALALITSLAFFAAIWFGGPHLLIEGAFLPARFATVIPYDFAVPAVLTPLSATLLHGDWIHLAVNLVMLVFCGAQLERLIGPGKLLLLYGVGAYAAAIAQYLAEPGSSTPMIGASGAISALLGCYALWFGKQTAGAIGPLPAGFVQAVWLAAAWSALQWAISMATASGPLSIATAAHVGGFIAGLALAYPLAPGRGAGTSRSGSSSL